MDSLRFRQLAAGEILATLGRLRERIEERFPGSGLAQVAHGLRTFADENSAVLSYLARPHWAIRIGVGVVLAGMAIPVGGILTTMRPPAGVARFGELIQVGEAALSGLVFLGALVLFLVTLETRLKRSRALTALHQLRSLAHVVDMHQLTKDPERMASDQPDTPSSPERTLSQSELGRYLDYCSELLSLIAKVAALHVQRFNDPQTLAAVNDIESLTSGLSGKIWQKITLLDRSA
ncbi:MAG: hypothetical protein ACRENB_09380 [Gemmatimonadales bacterium]